MKVRPVLFLALAALAFSTLAGCLADFGTVEAPRWEAGYAFAYEGVGQFSALERIVINGEVVEEFAEEFAEEAYHYFFEVLDADVVAAGEPIYLAAMRSGYATGVAVGDESELVMEEFVLPVGFRHRDLEMVFPNVAIQMDCTGSQCVRDVDFEFRATNQNTTFIDFPLTKGHTWTSAFDEGPFEVRLHWSAQGAERLQLPIGEVMAVRIDVRSEVVDLDTLLNEAREEAEAAGIKVEKLDFDMDLQGSVWYSPEVGALVKMDFSYSEQAEVKLRHEGETFHALLRVEGTGEEAIIGANLLAGPTRTNKEINDILSGTLLLSNPAGGQLVRGTYTLALQADAAEVNAAESPSVRFAVSPSAALPESHTVAITLIGPGGNVVASAQGSQMEHRFDEPGVFRAVARATDGQGVMQAQAATWVTAHYEATLPFSCPEVGVAALPMLHCQALPVPVRPGVVSLDIRLTPPETGVASQVRLEDPAGNVVTDPSSIRITDFSPYSVGEVDWNLEWRPLAHVLGEGEFQVRLDYGDSAGAYAGQGQGGRSMARMAMDMGGLGQGSFVPWQDDLGSHALDLLGLLERHGVTVPA